MELSELIKNREFCLVRKRNPDKEQFYNKKYICA